MYFIFTRPLWSLYTAAVLLLFNYVRNASSASKTELALIAPVTPVKEGAIFAFRCQVWNVKPDQEVTLIREADKKRIFLNEILHLVEDRVFLAQRQMGDGSTVYFLTIMEVTRQDEGDYTCKITDTEGSKILSERLTLKTLYFPPDSDPQCHMVTADVRQIYAGTQITMNCTSHVGNPNVEIQWHESKSKAILTTVEVFRQEETITSVLRLRVTLQLSRAIFVCQISSKAFPAKTQDCHVGPFVVLSNPAGGFRPTVSPRHHGFINTDVTVTFNHTATTCEKQCELLEKPVIFWIVSTIATIIVAFIFLILVVVLFLKYRSSPVKRKYTGVHMGKIYDELPSRRQVNDRVYMSLVKLERQRDGSNAAYGHTTRGYDSP